ncbi:hypothetical protein [Methylophaga sp.]|uniref:head-tail joining protein n=1 Tax=Methylophaga sp. TaxID=2024840 RepID=UPI003A8ED48A
MPWSKFDTQLNDAVMSHLSDLVTVHYEFGDVEISADIEGGGELNDFKGGGDFQHDEVILTVYSSDALAIERYQKITVNGVKMTVNKPPKPDGTGLTELVMVTLDETDQRPDIRY